MKIEKKKGIYEKYFKRPMDFSISLVALIILSPLFLILTISGYFAMKGNPFFTQLRPGKDEKIFRLVKFRTMSNEKDANGNFLPNELRLNSYGKLLRSTSLDEIPQLLNILKGDLAIVGPRPLLISYLELYNDHQKRRHEVRPGLTGYAQVHGRNRVTWEEKFNMDVYYVDNVTFLGDLKIILKTIKVVLKREGITSETSVTMEKFTGNKGL